MFDECSFICIEDGVLKGFLGMASSPFKRELRIYAFAVLNNSRRTAAGLLGNAVLYANENKCTLLSCPDSKEFEFCHRAL
ncbi:MAG: hypothetical protein LIO87_07860, partial [Eubacterium sp.]|nr:hypothetical protein [Eubacterium sp.]